MTETEVPPRLYQYKVSLKSTTKCVEPDVTVYADSAAHVQRWAISLLKETVKHLKQEGFKVADIMVEEESAVKNLQDIEK
jgi:hypothetical protein